MITIIRILCIVSLLLGGYGIQGHADIRLVGSASNAELMSNLVIAFEARTGILVDLKDPGSLEGFVQLENGKADIAYISRELTEKEISAGFVGAAYCRDAIAVVVNPTNRLENLTREELKAIFTGNRAHWDSKIDIVVLIRDGFSGTRQFFEEKIMDGEVYVPSYLEVEKKGQGMMLTPIFSSFKPPFFPLIKRPEELLFSLAKIRGAITYLSVGRIPKESRVIKIDGVAPTAENIKSGNYFLSRIPSLVTRGQPTGEILQFIDFVTGAEGQKIVKRMGYIPITE